MLISELFGVPKSYLGEEKKPKAMVVGVVVNE